MTQKNLSELTDEELLQLAKNRKSTDLMNAVIIGFAIGIVAYSFLKNTLGLLTLLPLLFVYKLVNRSNRDRSELAAALKARNLG